MEKRGFMWSYYNTTEEIAASGVDTAILPIGSVEQHGSHLPLGTDYLQIKDISERVAEKLDAYLLPPLPIGNCFEHTGTRGTVWMSPRTLYNVLEDIVLSLKESGFSKVLVLSGHGGNFALYPCVRELNQKTEGLQVVICHPALTPEQKEKYVETAVEIHAGEMETSQMMYLYPDCVKAEEAKKNDFIPDAAQPELNMVPLKLLSPKGVWGCPSRANAEKGRMYLEMKAENTVSFAKAAFAKTPSARWIDAVAAKEKKQ